MSNRFLHRRWLLIAALLFSIAFFAFNITVRHRAPAFNAPTIHAEIVTANGVKIPLQLEVAATPEQRERGLMFRKTLAPNDGMTFLFPIAAPQKFWMKNTMLPLDMLFVDASGAIAYIITGVPYSHEAVGTDIPITSVIEIDGGRAARDGITVGDTVIYALKTSPQSMAR